MNCRLFAAVAAAIIGTTGPAAAEFVPAIIFDAGGKFDKSFNEAAYNGAERFKAESGIAYRESEIPQISQRVEIIRNIARRGAAVIVAVGFSQAPAVGEVAREFPDTKFTLIDAVVDLPNVQSVIFKEHEGSFLVGMAAALASKTGKIGFIGGMDTPLIRKFWLGYTEGAKYINPGTTVVLHMVGTTPAAWNNPVEGGELANRQFDLEVDVIYAAAGGTGIGVYLVAKGRGKLAIGVDANQNYLYPGTMLTSMIKRVDVAVHDAFMSAKSGTWKSGTVVLGLKEDGVGFALDEYNRNLISPAMEARMEQARKDIIAGKIKVTDYTALR